ncbi:glycosyltransferase [Luteolibacter pohnpeiensis]|uniref:Glycosyltransferase n=1 Tax=Luteolibacter pohnpeiensis TaxID=454153 RepID=A0A934VWC1_9BACT|nr:nucleotide disphospho-sugar-binding domain-containing protein [Luteolibacter pohnpeiensis]MBK1883130.1 glycosyltransferase [Luteolibacter pohnpeiensis]
MISDFQPLRILLFALGSAGDVHPLIGLGMELKRRGHEVFVITNPVFRSQVEHAELSFRALGTEEEFELTTNDPDLWHPLKAFPAVVKRAVHPSYAPILEISRELHLAGKTILVASSLAFGARTARDLLEIPLVSIHLAPAPLPSVFRQPEIHGMPFGNAAPVFLKRLQWWLAGKVVDRQITPELNRFRKNHGLAPAKNVLADWWHSPDRVIALFPDWFAPAQPDWPKQLVQTGFPMFDGKGSKPIPPALTEFLDAGEPPVIFTPGSANSQAAEFFAEAAEALRLTGRRGVFISPYSDSIPENLPPGVIHIPYVPFSEVLPRAAALVYHGGIGTCAQALRAGIPQLVQPLAHDQFDTLSRVRELGVGLGLVPSKFKRHAIAEKLHQLLDDPSYRNQARAISSRFDSDNWLKITCEAIESTNLTI